MTAARPDPAAVLSAAAARPAASDLLLVLDLDALDAAADGPGRLPPAVRAGLALLAHRPRTSVILLGMRRAAALEAWADLGDPVGYVGLRGGEIRAPDLEYVQPDLATSTGLVERVARSLEPHTADLRGVTLERTSLSLTLHVGEASADDAGQAEDALYRVVGPHIESGHLRCFRGRHAFDVVPHGAWDEADAVARVMAEIERRSGRAQWPLCLADEVRVGGFPRLVAGGGALVLVGDRPVRAELSLRTPDAVAEVLRELVKAEIASPGGPSTV